MRVAPPIVLSEGEREQLQKWSRGRSTPYRLVLRAKIVLGAADGLQNREIAAALGTEPDTVGLWRRRFHFHFVPTGSSWLNLVERWFSELTQKRIRRGTFRNVRELITAIKEFLETYLEDPRPFVWTAKADNILRKVAKNRELLVSAH